MLKGKVISIDHCIYTCMFYVCVFSFLQGALYKLLHDTKGLHFSAFLLKCICVVCPPEIVYTLEFL